MVESNLGPERKLCGRLPDHGETEFASIDAAMV